jgi:transcription termination factor Rho
VRAPKDTEKYFSLLRVETVNSLDPEVAKQRPHFENLTAIFPDERIAL